MNISACYMFSCRHGGMLVCAGTYREWVTAIRDMITGGFLAVQSITLTTAGVEFFVESVVMVHLIKMTSALDANTRGGLNWGPTEGSSPEAAHSASYLTNNFFLIAMFAQFILTMQVLELTGFELSTHVAYA